MNYEPIPSTDGTRRAKSQNRGKKIIYNTLTQYQQITRLNKNVPMPIRKNNDFYLKINSLRLSCVFYKMRMAMGKTNTSR